MFCESRRTYPDCSRAHFSSRFARNVLKSSLSPPLHRALSSLSFSASVDATRQHAPTSAYTHAKGGRAGAASRWRSVPTSEGLHHDADLLDGDAALALLVKERKDLAVLIALLRLQLVLWRARDYE